MRAWAYDLEGLTGLNHGEMIARVLTAGCETGRVWSFGNFFYQGSLKVQDIWNNWPYGRLYS